MITAAAIFTFLKGVALEGLHTLGDETVHAVPCDPPNGLTNTLDLEEMLRVWLDGETFGSDVDNYAGASWDNSVPGPHLWREAHWLFVPGGSLPFQCLLTIPAHRPGLVQATSDVSAVVVWSGGQGIFGSGSPTLNW
jgi:hypothetical protein